MESETAVSTVTSVASASTSNVLYVINDLDPDPSPSNMFLKHPLGLNMNVQDLHLLATANLIAQTQETIAQQYNIPVEQESVKQLPYASKSVKTEVKGSSVQSLTTEKSPKRSCFSVQKREDSVMSTVSSLESKRKPEPEPPAMYFCTHCKASFDTGAELKNHHKHHNIMECSYPGCNRKFTWPAHFKYHQLTHKGDKRFICGEAGCHRMFYTAQHLEVHQRTHSNAKPFPCPDCKKAFATAGNLRNHRRCHTGEKPFACDYQDCDRRFAELSTLKKHKITHTGKKAFQCDICGKSFTQSSSRKTHMKTHKDGKHRKGSNMLSDPRETSQITNELKGDKRNGKILYKAGATVGTVDTVSEPPSEETAIKEGVQVISEEAFQAHINESVGDTNSRISIVVLSPDQGNQNEIELNHVTVQVTNPDEVSPDQSEAELSQVTVQVTNPGRGVSSNQGNQSEAELGHVIGHVTNPDGDD